jgi:hypothetical protein
MAFYHACIGAVLNGPNMDLQRFIWMYLQVVEVELVDKDHEEEGPGNNVTTGVEQSSK